MATMKLTENAVRRLPSPADVPQAYYWDEEVTGLGVVVGKTGTKTFVVYGRLAGEKGRRIKHKIGIHGQPRDDRRVWSVELARAEAKVVLGKLAMGTNPNESADDVARRNAGPTLREGVETHLARMQRKGRSPRTIQTFTHETNKYLADWLDRPFSELTGEKLAELHQQIKHRAAKRTGTNPANDKGAPLANRVIAHVSASWRSLNKKLEGKLGNRRPRRLAVKPRRRRGHRDAWQVNLAAMPSTWGLATTSLVALAMWSACSRKQEPPGDCEVIKTHWMKLVVAESGDPANAQRMYDVCQREKFGAPYIECLRRATDVKQGIACGPTLSGAHRDALRMAHEQAAKAPPPPVQQQPPPPLVWPTPQPAGPAYALYDGKLWMIDVDGKVAKIGAMSSARDLMVASGGDVLAFGSFPVSVARIRAATVSRLPAPKLRGTQVAVDARADRVLVAASDGSSEKGYKTQLAVYDGTAWTAPETVADVGAVTAVMLAADDETWVIGFNGVSRRRGGTWKSWKCPGRSCIYSALARRGETPVILIDDNGRWRTFIVDDKDELVVDMPKGVDWASNGAGRNGVLVETGGGTIRARVGPEITSATTDWDVAWRGVVDGANRFWYRANGGLAVTDIQHETSTYYPSGAPLLAGAAEPSSIAVIGGGPTLPAPQTPKLASKVTGKLKVNGGIQANTPFKVCPAMRDAGNADPCAKSKPVLSGKTNASGAFELADVPAGDYDLAMYLTTSDGKSTWAVVRPAFTVRSGGVARVGTLQLNVSEHWRY